MKTRYTITIADMQMNVLTEESEASVNELVSTIDRRIREINTRSRHCSKTEAALLCALDYCADKFRAQRRVKTLEAELAFSSATIERLKAELAETNAKLEAAQRRSGGYHR
ncbi:MAG: cell division protein ZapA [Clostridia bacterium]|nr:cell division protein ZapA [Clostridia bacterium]